MTKGSSQYHTKCLQGWSISGTKNIKKCKALICLILELLYQEYREKSTYQEIETRRMQDCAEKNRTEFVNEGKPQEVKSDTTIPAQEPSQPVKLTSSTNNLGMKLWQNTEKVRSSTVLSTLSRKEIKLQEVRKADKIKTYDEFYTPICYSFQNPLCLVCKLFPHRSNFTKSIFAAGNKIRHLKCHICWTTKLMSKSSNKITVNPTHLIKKIGSIEKGVLFYCS